jgi:3-isopropylmalate dehydrogenase
MKTHRIAVLPGDGIGPEVVTEALKVLRAAAQKVRGLRFEFNELAAGAGEYLRSGNPLPDSTLEGCREHDAVLLGAMGLPHVRRPNGLEIAPQLDLREKLDLYCGLRPLRLFHGSDSPLKGYAAGALDFVIVRENTEGLFFSRQSGASMEGDHVDDTLRITRLGAERIFRSAFQQACQRRKLVTLVDKANVLPSMSYFRAIFDEVAREYPTVRTERIYIDASTLYLVQRPHSFDVIVTENMFGDILSDLGAGLVGGMGMAPSGDIGDRHAVFQPSHGSAPDIMGKGIANPVATILSVVMMLEWLRTPETLECAQLIRRAVEYVLGQPQQRTRDLGGALGTAQMGDLIAKAV